MTKKTPGKQLLNIEKHFVDNNPVLLDAAKVFHELDQLEFDLGLIGADETTASQHSWWPIISVIGGSSQASSRFINQYLNANQSLAGIQSSNHKFTVLQHNSQNHAVTLPGAALDLDHRLPFYRISRKLEREIQGEGKNVNAYLELKTVNNERLKGKLIIESPNFGIEAPVNPITKLLTRHIVEISDLVLVFCDVFDSELHSLTGLSQSIAEQQDSNKFVYVIDHATANAEVIKSWQKRLAELGIKTGQFVVLSSQANLADPQNKESMGIIDERIENLNHYRSYRILQALEQNIRDVGEVVMPEVKQAIELWKERAHFSSLLILGSIVMLMLFAEIQMGFFAILFDPIVGPLALVGLIAFMAPLHITISKLQAKLIVGRLEERQKELHLLENLAEWFEKSLTNTHMLLPINTPVGWNKKTKLRLAKLSEKAKELVIALNDGFNVYEDRLDNTSKILESESPDAE
ncbi:hypothetical protein [Methylotuvimicrobium sp. KM2]|uniref:hypothetical protein n=1 Tax=Methylotuvimicrobium sp. KM2 TaxID=3133976 RepID=UPI003100C1C9